MPLSTLLRALCAATFSCAAATAAAAAQAPSPSPSPTVPPEIAHVITSDRSEETLANAARTIYVVNKTEMIAHGYRTVGDAIESLPGVNLSRYGSSGALVSTGIRGSTFEQVLVLIDGLPAPGSQTTTLDLGAISTAGVDRIEVVEGGGSTLYGAGSVGGIINIITAPGVKPAFVAARIGSFGDSAVRLETRNLSFERDVAANTYRFPGGVRSGADAQSTTARFSVAGALGHALAELSGGISDQHASVPGSIPPTFTTPSRQRSVERDIRAQFTFAHAHATSVLELGASGQQFLYACNDPSDPNCFTPFPALTTESRVQAGWRNTVLGRNSKTTYGIDIARGVDRIDDGGASNLFSPPDTPIVQTHGFSQAALYAQHQWIERGGSRYYIGARAERDGAQGGIVAPSVGFSQRLSPALTLRGNFATAFRAPTAIELYYPGYGTPQLQPERSRVADLRLSDGTILGGVALTWFTSSASNLITTDPATFTAKNIGRASSAGFTLEAQTQPVRGLRDRLSVTDLYRALDLTPGSFTQNTRYPGAGPVFLVTNELLMDGTPGTALDSAGIIVRNRGGQTAFGTTQPYTRVDAFARLRIARELILSLRAWNVGNAFIADQPGYPQPGRAFSIELSTR